jgi:hypothetical protein
MENINTKKVIERIVREFEKNNSAQNIIDTCEQDLLEYYSDYELECYNDSTLFKGYIEIIDTTYNSMWYDYQTFYTQKEPTFKGFLEYLKKRLKD